MLYHQFDQTDIILICVISVLLSAFPIVRWLYLRSSRISNNIRMMKMTSNIIHELVTPLSILSASVEHLRATQPGAVREYDLMDLNIQRTIRLLQQTLESVNEQGDSQPLIVSKGDVMKHITETAYCTEPLMSGRQLEFSINCTPDGMIGWIDTGKVDKIIFNLLSMAAQNTPERGRVALEATTSSNFDRVVIKISYTAEGRLRNQGAWGSPTLSLVRQLVYQHMGTIQFKPQEGVGVTFQIELPITKEAFKPSQIDENRRLELETANNQILDVSKDAMNKLAEIHTTTAGNQNTYSILIVDSSNELRTLMQMTLHQKYHVITASNSQEAIEAIHHNHFDLIVCDGTIPNSDGYGLTSIIKHDPDYSHLPIILLTSKMQEEEDAQRALTAGADSHLAKPFRLGELQLHIDNLIANRQRIRQTAQPLTAIEQDSGTLTATAPVKSPSQEFLERATQCIFDHLDDSDYDRYAFAADMGASASTLYNKLRAVTGMNVTAFIRDIRIKEACRMAKEDPELRVSDIAYRVGFKDPKYFATTFKKEVGMQPKEYFDSLRRREAS